MLARLLTPRTPIPLIHTAYTPTPQARKVRLSYEVLFQDDFPFTLAGK